MHTGSTDNLTDRTDVQTPDDVRRRNDLFLDALTDIAVHVGWRQAEFEDSRQRSSLLRGWAEEFTSRYHGSDWESVDYIDLVDAFAEDKLRAYMASRREPAVLADDVHRITDLNIFSGSDGRTYIRCRIDGCPQAARQLKFADIGHIDDSTARFSLAARYFSDVLQAGAQVKTGVVTDVVTYPGLNNIDRYIHCSVNGVRQSAKKLSDEDRDRLVEFLEQVRQSKDWEASRTFHRTLAGKYFESEIRQVQAERTSGRGVSR